MATQNEIVAEAAAFIRDEPQMKITWIYSFFWNFLTSIINMGRHSACLRVRVQTLTQDSVNKTISCSQIKVYCPVLVFWLDLNDLC